MQYGNKTTRDVADVVTRILSGQSVSEELKGDQHKIDANNNNKIDAEDFELLRKKKKVEEDFEHLDELSKTTLRNYLKGSRAENQGALGSAGLMSPKARSLGRTERDKEDGRQEGSKLAKRKLGAPGSIPAKVMAKEDFELTESHFKVGDMVKCKSSGMKGEVVKLDKEDGGEDEKYYTFKREDGKVMKKAPNELSKINEDVEDLQEYEAKQGVYRHKGTYGSAKGAEFGATDYKKENDLAKAADKEKKKPARTAYGARQNFVRSYAKESFSNLIDLYRDCGLKSLQEALFTEEPTNDEFTKELEDHKAKAALKKKQPVVAKASVQAVKVVEDYEVLDANEVNGVKFSNINERSLTEPEMKKKEKIVKGMKKGVDGFKDRYGDRAKSVMYATATKMAKKD